MAIQRPRRVGAAVGGRPLADAERVHLDPPPGMVLEPVVGGTQGLQVGDGGGAVGVTDDVVELTSFGGGGAPREPAGPVARADGAGRRGAWSVGGRVLPSDGSGDRVA